MDEKKVVAFVFILGIVLLCGCSMKVRETHHLGIWDHEQQQFMDFYRIKVLATAQFSTAHYTSGIYDEKAVDLMFNEFRKSDPDTLNSRSLRSLSSASGLCSENTGADKEGTSEGICVSDGVFVFILSTDARAIADTIATFAQSEALASAIYSLANKEVVAESKKIEAYREVRSTVGESLAARINLFFNQADIILDGPGAEDDKLAKFRENYLQLLYTIARPLGRKSAFDSLMEANVFFSTYEASAEADL